MSRVYVIKKFSTKTDQYDSIKCIHGVVMLKNTGFNLNIFIKQWNSKKNI